MSALRDSAPRSSETDGLWALLESIPDPEIPVISIVELGILRDVCMHPSGEVEVIITPTYSGCPAIGQIEDDIRAALIQAGHGSVKITTQLAPAWTTDWMGHDAKAKLRTYGIAPPQTQSGADSRIADHAQVIAFAPKKVANNHHFTPTCPRCDSENVTETSHFGSTACKALYKCLSCLEPFDHFKPY